MSIQENLLNGLVDPGTPLAKETKLFWNLLLHPFGVEFSSSPTTAGPSDDGDNHDHGIICDFDDELDDDGN